MPDLLLDPTPERPPGGPDQPADAATPLPAPLLAPREGLPAVTATDEALRQVIDAFAAGNGPVAVDAERASGYRYGQSAYLVQLRRAGAGTALVDPVGCPDLTSLGEAIADAEWVLHAASQDLPCLAELGMRPSRIFDTELAARLAGHPRVGLGPLVEEVLDLSLEKGHSAADWSTRPLPESWLLYAALDVEVLVELRDALAAELDAQGKRRLAEEEFAAIVAAPPAPPRVDPWRRTSGLHKVRGRRQLAVVRELWEERERMARRRDTAPGRILPDAAVVEAAQKLPTDLGALLAIRAFNGRATRRSADTWLAAVTRALALPESALPASSLPHDGPPPARAWAEKDPEAAARLARAREAVAAVASVAGIPVENVVSPDAVRRLVWQPPEVVDAASVADALRSRGVRDWQIGMTADVLVAALLHRAGPDADAGAPVTGVAPRAADFADFADFADDKDLRL